MYAMFAHAESFNQPLSFHTSQVRDMSQMFYDATSFNQPLSFDTPQVTHMSHMFMNARAFNQPITFDTAQVTNMEQMFQGATAMTYPFPSVSVGLFPLSSDDDEEMKVMEEEPCEDKSRQLCVVCYTNCVDTVMVPCGHACMCHGCAKRVKETSGKCPICRRLIENINTIIPNIYYAGIPRNNVQFFL